MAATALTASIALAPSNSARIELRRAAEVVGEDAEPAAVGHADHDLARALGVRHLEDLVEHRHDRVEALDREHLLAQVGLLDVALEAEDLDQPVEQRLLLLGLQRLAVPAGLDHLAQPHPLLVRGEVLDLVRDRAAVGLAHPRQRLEQRLALDADPQDLGRDLRHQLRRQVEVLGLDRGVALGLGAERVEPGGEVAVGAVGLEQRGRRLHRLQQLGVRLRGRPARRPAGAAARRPAAAPRRRRRARW